jgi:hypothetical protein
MANIPQHCSMSDLDSCWLSSQMPLEQEIDNDAKQMANQFHCQNIIPNYQFTWFVLGNNF